MRSFSILGSTLVTSPTKPMSWPSEYFFSTVSKPPSWPLIPAAFMPMACIFVTSSLLTLANTISASSMVSASVTRRPLTNLVSIPTLSTHLLISLPPPCTIMGLNPISFSSTTSSMTYSFNSSSIMALPPYFTTITFLLKRCIYGSASIKTSALSKYF